jgi:ABC-type multidrug transport system ATPase subunit
MGAEPVLRADALTRIFAAGAGSRAVTSAVVDVTFAVEEHQIVAIVGANGAGKTTLIDLLAGVLAPTSGSLHAAGAVGYVPSGGRALYPRLTALHNLQFFGALHGMCPADARERGEALLGLAGAASVAAVRVDRLSDGMIARVSMARALLHDPAVLLLDEPGRSIDPGHRVEFLRMIREYTRRPGKGAVMVTHDIADVFEIADLVGVMQAGRLGRIEKVSTRVPGQALLHKALQEPLS